MTRAKRSIATFKLRQDMPIGCKVTLRGQRMYEFLDRLITVALPRVRDFRGISRQELRRARQFCARSQGAARLPRNRLRSGRCGARDGCRHRHDRKDRRGGQGACSKASICRLPIDRRGSSGQMAKKSSIEKNARRTKLAKQHRREAQPLEGDRDRPRRAAGRAVCGAAEAGRVAAQQLRNAGSQPLLCDRPAARVLPQIQAVAHCAARTGLLRADPRHGQVELVGESPMTMSDPLGDMLTRIRNGQRARQAVVASPASKFRANVLEVLKREGYIRGFTARAGPSRRRRAQDRAEIRRWRAGDPRDLAGVETGPAYLFADCATCRGSITGSGLRSCRPRAGSCRTTRPAPQRSAARCSAAFSEV